MTSAVEYLVNSDASTNDKLAALRLDEIVTMNVIGTTTYARTRGNNWFRLLFFNIGVYTWYLRVTWGYVFCSWIIGELPIFDWALTVVISLLTSIVLLVALIFCQLVNIPPVRGIYSWISNRCFNGLGLINAFYPGLFTALTGEQIEYAMRALSSAPLSSFPPAARREFNLDIATLLLQLASVVYEHESQPIHGVLNELSEARPTNEQLPDLGALPPGTLVDSLFGPEQAAPIKAAFEAGRTAGEDAIRRLSDFIGLRYEPVSELNNSEGAYCSFFWKPGGNWVVVTFKGTTPFEFADWVTDFTVNLVSTGEFLQGLDGRINKGFKDRLWAWDPAGEAGLFPDGGRSWDTIRVALRVLAHDLAKTELEGAKVNVWFTGHSLGCGLASLAYARAINSPGDFEGSPVLIRDAYLFAAPVCGDRATSLAFNTLTAESEYVRTLWRVTNDKDAVATLLPQFGDYPHLVLSPTSPLGFAHLGAELQMRSLPRASNVTGSFFSFDTVVDVVSEFTEAQLRSQRDEQVNNAGARTRRFVELVAEMIPLLGRIIAHDTVLYWDQLSQISLGTLNWVH